MVGKLIKHELRALFRIILYVGIGAIAVALVGRILCAADQGPVGMVFSTLAIYAALVASLMAFVTSVAQFSRSFFTGEGYMTFSLPATPTQLILSKLISALIATFYGAAVAVIAVLIYISGFGSEVWEGLGESLHEFAAVIGGFLSSDPLLILEYLLLILASLPMALLFFYLLISVGQLFTGGRKVIPFVLTVVSLIALSVIDVYLFDPLWQITTETSLHLTNWLQIALYLLADFGMFFVIRYILTHKVNLIV